MLSPTTLHDHATIDYVINTLDTETNRLFKQLDFTFLMEYPIFQDDPRGRPKDHHAPELVRGLLHCFYHRIHGPRPITRTLQDESVWRRCGFTQPPSLGTIERFMGDLSGVIHDVFCRLGEQAAARGLLDPFPIYRIDATDVRADPRDPDASWNYDSTRKEYYYGYGCTLVTTDGNLPLAAAVTQHKSIDEETAMRVTSDALALRTPTVMIGDSGLDILAWHDYLLEREVVPLARYNPRNTNSPLPITYRIEDQIADHFECLRPSRTWLDALYKRRMQVENTIQVCKQHGLGQLRVRGRERATSHIYLTLCVRLLVALANADQNEDIASPFVAL